MKYKSTIKQKVIRRIIFAVAVLAALFAIATALFLFNSQTPSQIDTPQESSDLEDNNARNDQPAEETPLNESPLKTNPPSNNEDQEVNPIITISATNQTSSIYQVRAFVDIVTTEGTCTLSMTMNDQEVKRISEVQAGPSYTTCMGFDIPISELAPGEWDLNVSFSNATTSTATIKKVTIN